MSEGSGIVTLELNVDCHACGGATGFLETHNSLDPYEFIVARTCGNIGPLSPCITLSVALLTPP